MRLKKLQVSGFKSFVDSTDIRLPGHLVGVVGPNGCGKSNVIDAVRWVMGESSAKMLRGDHMVDVIFNGSSTRKPVGKASVELVFDNSDGQVPGNYGQFAEISVKRTLTRDGISNYSINNLKTQRRDVLDLFRGTGLGPRSYSIIEQGMVSRIVEARPEDLRVFVEEAAGTSKYKDRRRETENRIGHTRENLERVADIRDELGKQLRRLKRQSASARRYKVLKGEEREINGQLQVLRLNSLNDQLSVQDRLNAKFENALEAVLTEQRGFEAELEKLHKQQSEAHEKNNKIQQEFYQVGAEITRIEQSIEHQSETQQSQKEEVERLTSARTKRQQQIDTETRAGMELRGQLDNISPQLDSLQVDCSSAENALVEAEHVFQNWINEMESFNEQSRESAQQVEIQKSRIAYLEQHLSRSSQLKDKLGGRISQSTQLFSAMDIEALRQEVANHDRYYEEVEKQVQDCESKIKNISGELEEKRENVGTARTQLQEVVSRLDSLREIQNAALGGDNDSLELWLNNSGFNNSSRLAANLTVAEGWERAADRVLNGFLSAICADQINIDALNNKPDSGFSMISGALVESPRDRIELPRLIDKITSDRSDISTLLAGIYVADTLEQAMGYQSKLIGRECVVTRDGTLVGANWLNFASTGQLETGVLVRGDEIAQLQQRREEILEQVENAEKEIWLVDQKRNEQESNLQVLRVKLNNLRSEMTSLHNKFGREEAQYLEAQGQIDKLSSELSDISTQITGDRSEIENARALLETATEQSGSLEQQRESLAQRKELLNGEVVKNRRIVSDAREKLHNKALQKQKIEADTASAWENVSRLKGDIDQANQRLSELTNSEFTPSDSIMEFEASLNKLLERKIQIDDQFSISRDEAAGFDNKISELNSSRSEEVLKVKTAREELEQHKLARQEIAVRRETQLESIAEHGYDANECTDLLPEIATIEQWQETLADLERKIARIGPVNLVAIEEFDEESERMEYLDRQHADLTEALDTLESVIRKIDRETRTRFRETFDKINVGFNEFFPKLFGGGKAELLLTSDDLLTTGVSVMARPPGKRNSSIHLLSGGEKALTAVALLFSLFKLNPAPFCMLDEVDAPLDDANVDRYCTALKTLADVSQMIVITHNKITMESMDILVGVTMAEAGVSRLVSVDIDQAVEMAMQ